MFLYNKYKFLNINNNKYNELFIKNKYIFTNQFITYNIYYVNFYIKIKDSNNYLFLYSSNAIAI